MEFFHPFHPAISKKAIEAFDFTENNAHRHKGETTLSLQLNDGYD